MFNADFYPTPITVAELMLYGEDMQNKVILEPSAGKGDLVDYLYTMGAKEVIACELNDDLRKIVGTKCKIIANDFLSVTSDMVSHIDCIVMNPPFSGDEKHIIHAFNIAPDGCRIISLCNYQTYQNKYTRTREEFGSIVDQYGSIENLGSCFDSAERKTEAPIGLVKLKKPSNNYSSEFDGFFMEEEEEEQANGIMTYNVVRDIVNRYISAVKLFDEQIELGIKMHDLIGDFYNETICFQVTTSKGDHVLRNNFKKDLQKKAWIWVINKMNLRKYATRGLREDINKFVEQQQQLPFTMKNIYKMLEIVIGTVGARMDKAILEVFDKLTHHYHENRYCVEGWKTNSHYLINEKFIIPHICYQDLRWYKGGSKVQTNFSGNFEILEDLLKALCYLTGTNYDQCTGLYNHIHKINAQYGEWFEWEFFKVKCFKKGTAHFVFKDRDVWAILNQNIARIKGYPLPESVKNKKAA